MSPATPVCTPQTSFLTLNFPRPYIQNPLFMADGGTSADPPAAEAAKREDLGFLTCLSLFPVVFSFLPS